MCETGIPVSLLLNATDLEFPGKIFRVEFIDLHGDVLTEIPTPYYDTRPALYNVSNIVTPAEFFNIKVSSFLLLCLLLLTCAKQVRRSTTKQLNSVVFGLAH